MIRLEHVSFAYEEGRNALEDLSLTIQDGETVGLIGANGAGKSTLMKAMLGLISTKGQILVDDLPVEKAHLKDVRKRLGLLMQNSDNQLFMPTVYEDIVFGPLNYGASREEAQRIADELLEKLDLSELRDRHNHKLSGGEKRMAAIAAVLALEPNTILMDEPSSTLDPYNRRRVISLINSLPNTKLIASHDLAMIAETCKRVILLSKGKIIADGDASEILWNEKLLRANRLEELRR